MRMHQIARHRIIHDAHVLRRGGPPPHRHRMARLHVIIACCVLLMMARLVKVNGQSPSLQSTVQRCKGLLLLTLWGSSVASSTAHLLSPGGRWNIDRKPEDVHLRVVNGSCPWDGDTVSLVVVGSERAGASSRYPSTYLVPAMLESDCRLGQRMSPRRRKPGAGPDPKCPTENHPRSLLFPMMARSPSPSNKYSTRCDAVRRQHLQAGSLGRNAKYQHHFHPQCPADCSVAPNSIHAASHLAVPLWIFNPALLRLSEDGPLDHCPDSIWDSLGEHNWLVCRLVQSSGRCQEMCSHMTAYRRSAQYGHGLPAGVSQARARNSQVPRPNDRPRASSARPFPMRYRQ